MAVASTVGPVNDPSDLGVLAGLARMSVDEYCRVCDVLDWERTELVRGVVFDLGPEFNKHAMTVANVYDALREAFPNGYVVPGGTLRTADSMPMPDVVALSRRPSAEESTFRLGDVVVVVEVCVSSGGRDLDVKPRIYAEAGIPEYWVVLAEEDVLIRFTEPDPAGYAATRRVEIPPLAEGLDVASVRQ